MVAVRPVIATTVTLFETEPPYATVQGRPMIAFFKKAAPAGHYVLAGVLAALLPMAAGYLIFRANPSACYDGPCALPLLLVIVPPYAAPVLAVMFALNRRLEKPFPHGLLPTVLTFGVLGQIGLALVSVISAPSTIRRLFFSELFFIPGGFVVSVSVGLVFWCVMYALGRTGPDTGAGKP